MTDVLLKPAFQSAKVDSGDATKLGPTAWNAARLFSGGNDGEILTRSAASATGAAWVPTLVGDVVLSTDDAAAINAKALACAVAGTTLAIPAGTWTLTATAVFHCAVEAASGAIFRSDASPAVQVGDGATILTRKRVVLPSVRRLTKNWGIAPGPGAGVINTDVGVRIDDSRACQFYVPHIQSFSVGLDISGDAGALYHAFHIGHLDNNAINLRTLVDGVGGAVNECQWFGGRYTHESAEGVAIVGTRHIALLTSAFYADCNNHQFFGGSLEGAEAEIAVYCMGGRNQFYGLRWETPGAGVPRVVFDTAFAHKNKIFGGYDAGDLAITQINGAIGNVLEAPGLFTHADVGGTEGGFVLRATSSSAHPVLTALTPTGDPFGAGVTAPSATYGLQLSASALKGKGPADAWPRLQMDFATGRLWLNIGGSAAPIMNLRGWDTGKIGVVAGGFIYETDATYDFGDATHRARDVYASRSLRPGPVAFAALPPAAAGTKGMLACVTDSSTATWGATITGGGANTVLAFCNGVAWTVAGA